MTELNSLKRPTTIHCDNQSSTVLAKKKKTVVHQRSKHIVRKFQFIRYEIDKGSILLEYIEQKKNVVVLTKVLREFRRRFRWKRPALFKSGQWHFDQDNAPVHNSILVTDYLTKMGIKTVPHPAYSPDLIPCDFW